MPNQAIGFNSLLGQVRYEQQNHASTGNERAITTELSGSTETQDFMKKKKQNNTLIWNKQSHVRHYG